MTRKARDYTFKVSAFPSEVRPTDNAWERIPDDIKERLPLRGHTMWIGMTGGGKSSAMHSLVQFMIKHKILQEMVCCIGSLDAVATWKKLAVKDDCIAVLQGYHENELMAWFNDLEQSQNELREDGKPLRNVVLLLDDVATDKISSNGRATFLDMCLTRGRHAGVSVWIATQRMKLLSVTVRNQLSWACIFPVLPVDLLKIGTEFCGDLLPKEAAALFQEVTSMDGHHFVVYKTHGDLSRRFFMDGQDCVTLKNPEKVTEDVEVIKI